ncbi:MAG: AAA domain-containing protein [Iamia sp.]
MLDADENDLYDDTEPISGLVPVGESVPDKQSYVWTYHFDPDQEHKLKEGAPVKDPATERRGLEGGPKASTPGRIVALDSAAGTLGLRRAKRSEAPHPMALIPPGPLKTPEQRASLQRLAQALLDHGVDGAGQGRAARQLLARRPPQVDGVEPGDALRRPDEPTADAAVRLVRGLQGSYLPIQGPPGAGKTYTAAKVIVALVSEGKQVGITANSHAVIGNVLKAALKEAAEQGVAIRAMQKPGDDGGVDNPSVEPVDNPTIEAAVAAGEVDLIAGTPWLFSRLGLADTLDTLVVDEAGQLSLANVAAVAPSARNLVLVGDPRQLAQPSKGTHPEGAGASALDHVLDGAATVADEEGLFLDRTWRLHPKITAFISEQVYDGRLRSQGHCARQTVADGPVVGGFGLRWCGVTHEGNRTSSTEEAGAVALVYEALIGRPWTDGDGEQQTIGADDILVVAPYNAQVRLLTEALGEGARVGTVDKFQGQEAAVVIVSLAASSAEDIPRGMEFLYSRNRLNVAVSRAQALAVMVASPTLLSVRCHSVAQMKLANVLCRYAEMATPVDLGS